MAKILVIDDEESIRYTFESFLSDEGHSVTTARTYYAALEKIAEENFDLIFADIVLAEKTGIDILRAVKERDQTCPVVIITGNPDIETASEAVRLGAFDYMQKPVRQETLLHVASAALKHKTIIDEKEKYRSNLDAIFRSVKDAIIMVDEDLVVVEVNEAAGKICGLSREAIGKPFASIPQGCHGCIDALKKTLEDRQPVEVYGLECRLKDRPRRVVNLSTSLIDRHGLLSGVVLVMRDETRLADLEMDLKERRHFHKIVGKSEKMQQVYSLIEALANVQTTVLITGESGTGKELVAEALHFRGNRSDKPLVKVNCSALTENLLESELFGHVKGAFTGAVQDKIGRFERADGGTIFLDEIGDISPAIQQRLLRVLQETEFERVGASTPIKVDVRVIAATNKDLREKVRKGEFREDLYYRLKVVELSLPPLRDRWEDIPLLMDYFLNKFNRKFNRKIVAVSPEVRNIFMDYQWPGNVRELEHALEHAFILCRQNTIAPEHLPPDFRKGFSVDEKGFAEDEASPFLKDRQVTEHKAILQALEGSSWDKVKAAKLLGISERTLYRKIKQYKIEKR
jgi:two-component system response regulator HydG